MFADLRPILAAGLFLLLAVAPATATTTAQHRTTLAGEWASAITAGAFPQWTRILEDQRTYATARRIADGPKANRGNATAARTVGAHSLGGLTDLQRVNRAVNAIRYVADRSTQEHLNPWMAPHEFIASGGDCEDYAIAKYFALRALGHPPEALRILFVTDLRLRQPHAVLLVRLGQQDVVLDNQSDQIRPWSDLSHYRPIYSVNEAALWLHQG